MYGKVLDDRGSFLLSKSVDKIRAENKGWEVTGEPNAMGDQSGVPMKPYHCWWSSNS